VDPVSQSTGHQGWRYLSTDTATICATPLHRTVRLTFSAHDEAHGALATGRAIAAPRCLGFTCLLMRTTDGCEMTKALDPLLCFCTMHSAVFIPAKKKRAAGWMVRAVQRDGQQPRPVTTVSQKEKALEHVRALCAGTHKSQSRQVVAAPSEYIPKADLRAVSGQQPNYDDTVRVHSKPAGPGRGHKREPESAFHHAEAVLKKAKPSYEEVYGTLKKLTSEYRLLQNWYSQVLCERDRAYSLLVRKYELDGDPEREAVRQADRRAMVTELVG
jgi:hypothetical protein